MLNKTPVHLYYNLCLIALLFVLFTDEGRKEPVSMQDIQARDSKGRPRFHGAFTGGFSAGYFNTVGSKEGMKFRFNRGI